MRRAFLGVLKPLIETKNKNIEIAEDFRILKLALSGFSGLLKATRAQRAEREAYLNNIATKFFEFK